MREEKWHSARISPDIENLHHHCWDLREERGQDWGREGGEGNRTEAERGRGCGVRDRGGRMCPGTGCRETAETKKGREKRRERKLRQDSCLPGYPHLFIDLGMIECDWVAAWQQKSSWRLHVDELIVAETLGSRLLMCTISDVWKRVWTVFLIYQDLGKHTCHDVDAYIIELNTLGKKEDWLTLMTSRECRDDDILKRQWYRN